MRYLLLIISSILLLLYSCRAPNYCQKSYDFNIPIQVNLQDTFHIGDTIWISLDMPNQVLDRASGEYIDWTNFELFFEAGFSRLDTPTPATGDLDFDIIQNIGEAKRLVNGSVDIFLHTQATNNKKFRVGFIAKRAGLYSGGVFFPLEYLLIEQNSFFEERLKVSNPDCQENISGKSTIRVNGGNVNYHLVDGICQTTWDGLEICTHEYDHFNTVGGFAFVVAP